MNTERSSLDGRVVRHAALADPARLGVVDLLSLGDRSPTELRRALDLPSNLLAHHLKVLEDAGLLTRGRSEADRRRTYVQLVPDAIEGLVPGAHASARRVVFVCTANTARSQLAAALWSASSDVPVTSAGTHPADLVDPGAVAAARRHRVPLRAAKPQLLDNVATDDDFVITVCDRAHEEIGDQGALHWSVPDPVRMGTDAAFDAAIDDLTRRVGHLAPRLTPA
jgi:ArsR family transcriptional regulator, arsenate/arsenite/antimonite-responsive transcriptional repressor / arsenate reductase (thioredoxin)